MKKIIVGVIISLFVISGCSGSKEDTSVCSLKQGDGELETIYTVVSEDNKVTSLKYETIYDMSVNPEAIPKDELVAYGKEMKKTFKDVEGVTFSYQIKEKKFMEAYDLEVNKDTLSTLYERGFTTNYVKEKDKKIDAKKMITSLKDTGMECKEK